MCIRDRLLLDHDPYGEPNRVVSFKEYMFNFVGFDSADRPEARCWTASVVCIVPPKPEIEGWEAVEFREPMGGDMFQGLNKDCDCQGVMSRDQGCTTYDHKAWGRRRWILKPIPAVPAVKRKQTEQVEPAWLPVETNKPILEKPMKEKSSFKSKIKSLLWWSVACLLYTSPSPRDATLSRMPSSA